MRNNEGLDTPPVDFSAEQTWRGLLRPQLILINPLHVNAGLTVTLQVRLAMVVPPLQNHLTHGLVQDLHHTLSVTQQLLTLSALLTLS